MMRTGRSRWVTSLLLGASVIAATLSLAAPAWGSGGGGCGRPVTDARGLRVEIRAFCFTPTVLHVDRGETVTWTNRDPFAHNVMGASAAWGTFDFLKPDRSINYRFVQTGTYPFVCTLHPGMVGAVVVGNGNGPALERTTTGSGPVVTVPGARVSQASVAGSSAGPWPAAAFAAFGLFLAAVASLVLQRRAIGRNPPPHA
jgi:plastocyanin